jgi:beta-1,4-mannosyl-glycoprotein beta-1,4-N-acetylglucosaminyltransferase
MIFDTFIFNKDFTVLDIRLNELYDSVDKFVLVEADSTFQGAAKPYYFDENKDRYSQFLDKIIHIKHRLPATDTWGRERDQRMAIGYGLTDAQPDDIIIVSDADEIPRASVLATLDPVEVTAFNMNEYYYSLNMFNSYYGLSRACYFRDWRGADTLRRWHTDTMPVVENAGWHFSYLYDAEGISEKIQSFSHYELNLETYTNPEKIRERMAAGDDLYDRKTLERREIDETYPKYVLDNIDKFQEFIL